MFIADEIVEAGTLGGGGGENASQDVSLTSRLLEAFTQFLVQFSFVPPPEKRWRWSSGHLGDALRCADKKGNAKAWFGKREWSGDEEGESVREEERRDRREEVGREIGAEMERQMETEMRWADGGAGADCGDGWAPACGVV